MTDQYIWTDNPTESGIAECNTDILNDCLMHLKYDKTSGGGLPIGTEIAVNCTADYVPSGCLPMDGVEYTKAQFPDLWDDYLTRKTIENVNLQQIKSGYYIETSTVVEYASQFVGYSLYMGDDDNIEYVGIITDSTINAFGKYDVEYLDLNNKIINIPQVSVMFSASTIETHTVLGNSLLNTCTYNTYQTSMDTYGQCAKFAVDTVNEKFRVPYKKDGSFTQQALTNDELCKCYNAELPNVLGSISAGVVLESFANSSGAIKTTQSGTTTVWGNATAKHGSLEVNASYSSDIYSDNCDTVQPNAIALRYFIVVASGTVNDSMMDWSAWASSLQGKTNTDLSNLTSVGKKVIDGQWVKDIKELSTATAKGTYSIDLSDYLPNDNYSYEVIFNLNFRKTDTTGSSLHIGGVTYAINSSAGSVGGRTNRTIFYPIGLNRTFTYSIEDSNASQNTITAMFYRRIGTNS